MALSDGTITPLMRVIINSGRSMALGFSDGLMAPLMMVSLETTISRARESTNGPMAECTQVIGSIIRCTERAHLLGLMAESITETTCKTRKRASENSSGKNPFYSFIFRPDGKKYRG